MALFYGHLEDIFGQDDNCFVTTTLKTVTATPSQYERDGETLFASPTGRHPCSAENDKSSERGSFICHKGLPTAPF